MYSGAVHHAGTAPSLVFPSSAWLTISNDYVSNNSSPTSPTTIINQKQCSARLAVPMGLHPWAPLGPLLTSLA